MRGRQGREGTPLSQAQPQPSPRRCPHLPAQSPLAPPQPLPCAEATLPGRLVMLFLVPASPINRLCTQPGWWVTAQLPLAWGGRGALAQGREARPRPSLEEEVRGPQRSLESTVPSQGGQGLLCCREVGSEHSCGPPPKGRDTLRCGGFRAQSLQVHVPTLGGETGRGPGPPPASPQRRVQTSPHQARPMTSPGGARELPASSGLRGPNLRQVPCCLAS